MKVFGYSVIITKTPPNGDGSTMLINKKFAKEYCRRFKKEQYTQNRLPYIKQLITAHRSAFGRPSGLQSTKRFLDEYFNYDHIMTSV